MCAKGVCRGLGKGGGFVHLWKVGQCHQDAVHPGDGHKDKVSDADEATAIRKGLCLALQLARAGSSI